MSILVMNIRIWQVHRGSAESADIFKVLFTVKSSAPNSALHIQIFHEQGGEIITSNWDTGLLSYSWRAKLGYLEMNSAWDLHQEDI